MLFNIELAIIADKDTNCFAKKQVINIIYLLCWHTDS